MRYIQCYNHQHKYRHINLEPLQLRRLKADLVMYYKILNNLISINFDNHFTVRKSYSISIRSTGHSLLKPFCRTNRIVNNFFFRSINIWNALPVTITNATSIFALNAFYLFSTYRHFLFGHFNQNLQQLLLPLCTSSTKIIFVMHISLYFK